MDNTLQNQAEMKELKCGKSLGSIEDADRHEGTSLSIKDPDRMLSMIVLLIACLALAAMANVFVQ